LVDKTARRAEKGEKMKELMKVMIAYDGSVYADAAIDDLRRAGLAREGKAVIVSVVDSLASSPPISEFDLHSLVSRRAEAVLSRINLHRKSIIKKAEESASKAVARLRSQFPEWEIGYEVLHGTPAVELLRKADEWKPDLIVVGSHGRGAIGRFFLGSVSRKIAEQASSPVRVVRAAQAASRV
jgi:nucleotide-binding universal stress UspA family protein